MSHTVRANDLDRLDEALAALRCALVVQMNRQALRPLAVLWCVFLAAEVVASIVTLDAGALLVLGIAAGVAMPLWRALPELAG